MEPASGPAIRPAGPASSPAPCISSPRPRPSRPSRLASGPHSWKRTPRRAARDAPVVLELSEPRYPSLFQINTRVWLTDLSQALGRPALLDDIPDLQLDRLAAKGFDWVWLLSVWQTGLVGQRVSRENQAWRSEFEQTLPDLSDQDIAGSGFAIAGYSVH